MKFALILSVLALTSSAFATDFFSTVDGTECKIVNGVVTRTSHFGKEVIGSFTETKTVKLEGLEPFIRKAIETSSAVPDSDSELSFTMIHEGKVYMLNTRDSLESQSLVRMISHICR